jgi:TRAP-type uncharacterized transport system fused permease subunit
MTRPDENKDKASFELSDEELKKIVAEADTGGRKPTGLTAQLLLVVALAWSLFQLWIASPLPFSLGVFVFNDTESRAIHLAFAVFLAFAAYPAFKGSPRDHVPVVDWVFAAVGAFCAAYLFIFYRELAQRPGMPTDLDLAAAVVGMLLLLEAARRALGLPMVILAAVFLVYIFFGPYMPEVIAHRGASLSKGMSHHVADHRRRVRRRGRGVDQLHLPVRAVRCAAGDRRRRQLLHQVGDRLLGHMRGGPAKAAVVASA